MNCRGCAYLLTTGKCPLACTEKLERQFPDVVFRHFDTLSCSSDELCGTGDLFLVLHAEEILGIEDCWLENSPLQNGLSLNKRRIFIEPDTNENVEAPDWQRLFDSLSNRGAEVIPLPDAAR